MASLRLRGNSYHVCFRFAGKQYDRSLKTTDKAEASCALHGIEQLLHRLHTGQKSIPNGVDPGCFIVSGVTERPVKAKQQIPTLEDAVGNYLRSCEHRLSESYVDLQRTHLGHFRKFLGNADSLRCDQIVLEQVEEYLQSRLSMRDPVTVRHERNTLIRFFDWAVNRKYTTESPAAASERITAGTDRDRFRTKEEITKILSSGDYDETETMELWECLFLNTAEIAELLQVVRSRSIDALSIRLHSIPAYTGMRRGEVLRLKWIDVDFDENFLTARSRKQSRQQRETARRIDLHPELRELLLTWQSQCKGGRHVIGLAGSVQPVDRDKANRLFWRPMRGTEWCIDSKKNWFKIGFHSYRHSFASNLAAAGANQRGQDSLIYHLHSTKSIAVGTVIADRPPHRSVRAELPHTAPPLGSNGRDAVIFTCRSQAVHQNIRVARHSVRHEGVLRDVALGWSPFLHELRYRCSGFVRPLLRYYGTI